MSAPSKYSFDELALAAIDEALLIEQTQAAIVKCGLAERPSPVALEKAAKFRATADVLDWLNYRKQRQQR
jgi:hypothetical protein